MIEQMKNHIYTVDDKAYWKNKFYQIMDGYFILKILKQDSHETN